MPDDLTIALKDDLANESSWDRWFRSVYPQVYFVMYRITEGDRDLAEDLVQGALENFIASEAIDKVGSDAEAYGYLLRTARNLFIDGLRRRAARESTSELVETVEDKSGRQRDELLSLDQLAERLAPDDQVLLKLVRAGKSIREVAKELGVSYSTAGVRVHRLREKLKNIANSM